MNNNLKRTDPVTVLDLEPRTQRLLEREEIKTIGDLMLLIRTDKLLAIRNIGARGYKAIIDQVGCNTPLWDGWHRTADCMPDDGEYVLIGCGGGKWQYKAENNSFWDDEGFIEVEDVKWWYRIPEVPSDG